MGHLLHPDSYNVSLSWSLWNNDRLHNHAGKLAKLKFGTPQMQHDVACTLTRRVSLVALKTHACSTSMAILNHVSADKVFNQPYKKNIPGFSNLYTNIPFIFECFHDEHHTSGVKKYRESTNQEVARWPKSVNIVIYSPCRNPNYKLIKEWWYVSASCVVSQS